MTLKPGHSTCPTCARCGLPTCPDCDTEGRTCPIIHDAAEEAAAVARGRELMAAFGNRPTAAQMAKHRNENA